MQVTLVQTEIETAILEYINKRVKLNDEVNISVDIKSTRGADGVTATIDIADSFEEREEIKEKEAVRRTTARNTQAEEDTQGIAKLAKQKPEPVVEEEEDTPEQEEELPFVEDSEEDEEEEAPKVTGSIFDKIKS